MFPLEVYLDSSVPFAVWVQQIGVFDDGGLNE